jgi:hypothetical protein
MKPETLELYAKYARKYQLDVISIAETGANFKEYDGDGYFIIKKSRKEIEKELTDGK